MRKIEVVYLAAVMAVALLFAGLTLRQGVLAISRGLASESPAAGTAGKPRDVDLNRIRKLIREKHLSDHEAEFYREVPGPGSGPPKEGPPR